MRSSTGRAWCLTSVVVIAAASVFVRNRPGHRRGVEGDGRRLRWKKLVACIHRPALVHKSAVAARERNVRCCKVLRLLLSDLGQW